MSSNFYDERGIMLGLDEHVFLRRHLLPITWVTGVPDKSLHVVGSYNGLAQNDKHTTSVTSEGHWMCQRGFSIEWVPHIPVKILLAALSELALLAFIIACSESKPKLWVSSVHGQGLPLACTVCWVAGYNANCDGHGAVWQENSVRTCPSVGDYAAAAFDVGANFLIGYLAEKWKIPAPIMWVFDKTLKAWPVDPIIDFVRDELQELIDDQ